MSDIRNRLTDLGLWNNETARPIFGWTPILFGWAVVVNELNPPHARVLINGVPWDPTVKIPWGHENPYAYAFKNFV